MWKNLDMNLINNWICMQPYLEFIFFSIFEIIYPKKIIKEVTNYYVYFHVKSNYSYSYPHVTIIKGPNMDR
jgi:hypothetical protein